MNCFTKYTIVERNEQQKNNQRARQENNEDACTDTLTMTLFIGSFLFTFEQIQGEKTSFQGDEHCLNVSVWCL